MFGPILNMIFFLDGEKHGSINCHDDVNMTEDFSLKALVLGTIRLGIKAKGRLLLGYKVGVSLD